MEIHVDELRVSPRRVLRPGVVFRVKRGSGPFNVNTGQPAGVRAGLYRCLGLYSDSHHPARIYCNAVHGESGRQHTLYVSGPTYVPQNQANVRMVPYRLHILPNRKERSHGRRKLVRR